VPHLEPYAHHRCSLDVVGLSEGRPPAAGTDVPDNGLDPMVIMVPVTKAAISVNPAVGVSAPVWDATAVGGTAATRAPARSATGASVPVRAAATVPPAPALPPSPA
jgi:hypothetical protein